MNNDFNTMSQEEFRERAFERATRAKAALDTSEVFNEAPVRRWISAAPPRQNRRKELTNVLMLDAAMVTNPLVIKRLGMTPATLKKWRRGVEAQRAADAEFATQYFRAIDETRKALAETARERRKARKNEKAADESARKRSAREGSKL